jgi:hypothetical protein
MKERKEKSAIIRLVCVTWVSLVTALGGYAQAPEPVTAHSANDFLNSIGVNSAIYRRGENVTSTIACAQYMGFRWIRTDEALNSTAKENDVRKLYEETGVKVSTSLGSGGNDINDLIAGSKRIAALGALLAIEGNNEPNNWGITYQGTPGGRTNSWVPVARLHRDLYVAVKADPVLKDYPVWATTETGAETDNVGLQYLTVPEDDSRVIAEFRGVTFADVANCHNYFVHTSGWKPIQNNQVWWPSDPSSKAQADHLYGNFGKTWSKKFNGYSEEQLRTLPRVTTETGVTLTSEFTWEWKDPNTLIYNTDKPNPDYSDPAKCITEELQGLMYLACYLDQFKQGWSYTAMYILRDRSDENGNQTFGFYDKNYHPRLAAHYLHNMTTILADDVTATLESPAQLTYAITNKPLDTGTNVSMKVPLVHDLLLQKSNGKFYLIVWSERYKGGSDNVEVVFDENIKEVKVYNPARYNAENPGEGTEAVASYSDVSSVSLTVTNHPFILEISLQETGVQPVAQEQTIYPNPVNDFLYIRHATDLKKLELFDLTGKNLLAYTPLKIEENAIDLTFLSNGCYILKTTGTNDWMKNYKIIKQ